MESFRSGRVSPRVALNRNTRGRKCLVIQMIETFVSFACSLYGCLSNRCKSGRGSWLFARVVIFDTPRGDPGGESSNVNVLAGVGLAIPSGRSIKRTLQPRYTIHVRTGQAWICVRRPCAKMGKARGGDGVTTERSRLAAGVQKMARWEKTSSLN
jgi:hypothetical protein